MLLMMEGLMLTITFLVSLLYAEDDGLAFLTSALMAFAVGSTLKSIGKKSTEKHLTRADSFLVVTLSWVLFSIIGMMPFILHLRIPLADAFFEAMSGFTTTGATIFSNIDGLSHGLRFWRSMMHWIGGLGIIVFSVALIPVYEMKNSNVYSAEVTGLELDKLKPKIGATARRTLSIYFLFTCICTLLLWAGPMDLYDAVCHAMSTVATGGFSTHTESIGFFHSAYVEYVCIAFMLLSSLNYSLFYYLSIRRPQVFLRNEEMHAFFYTVGGIALIFFLMFFKWPHTEIQADSLLHTISLNFRTALFHVSSIISSTGFAGESFDYVKWGVPFWMPTLVLMAVGACTGSTGGGIKMVRLLICAKGAFNEFTKMLHPRAVLGIRISGQVISNDNVRRALAFIFIYLILVVIGTFVLTLLGNDTETSLGSSISMLSNIGPAMGTTGPASNFAHIHDIGKWLMSSYMLVGRLEIFTVLLLFMPRFWKEYK